MRLWSPTLVVVALVVLSACGGDDDDADEGVTATAPAAVTAAATPEASSTAAPPPEGATQLGEGSGEGGSQSGTPLGAGMYYSELFSPRIVVTLGDGWGNAGQDGGQLLLLRRPEPRDIALTIDSSGERDAAETVALLRGVLGTEVTDVIETEVAGFPAKQFDITIVEGEQEPVRIPALSDVYSSFKGDMLRVWVVDVDGRTVKILAEAPGDEFAEYAQIAEAVVASMRFE